MPEPQTTAPSLLVFADDWGRHPSSCQHLVRELLPSHPAAWVNTIGTRRPSLNLATVRRGLEKIGHWAARRGADRESLPANLQLVSPKMWPWFTRAHDRRLNRRLLVRALRPVVAALPQPVAALTTIPIVADLVGELDVAQWIYYCVDDFSKWPGLDARPLAEMERDLVARVDRIVAAGENLQQRMAELGRSAELLTHGVDLAHWQRNGASLPLAAAEGFEPPRVVFWGLVDRRMDVEFLSALDGAMSQGTILLGGPLSDPDPALLSLPRVEHLPPLSYGELPALAAAANVLVMPYRDLPVTRAMQPLKLNEYLATGKPVVARDLPAVQTWYDALDIAESPGSFTAAVIKRLETGIDPAQRAARRRLEQETWAAKAARFEQFLRQ